ncbi:MAG: hypothetical protein PHQ75_13310 [Thermoguttaceae bacterium]|nr:hypothetical protein [Thermoguttaceae bacterium]
MSYTVQFYLVNLEELKKVFGSGDLSLLERLDFDEEDHEGRRRAQELIEGTPLSDKEGSGYGYALEKIVEALGCEWVSVEEFEDLRFGEFDGPLEWIIDSGAPIALPDTDDYPYVGYRELDDMKEDLASAPSEDEDEEDDRYKEEDEDDYDDYSDDESDYDNGNEFYREMLQGMYRVFRYAIRKKKAIITFYY